jgi:hypothetical protein
MKHALLVAVLLPIGLQVTHHASFPTNAGSSQVRSPEDTYADRHARGGGSPASRVGLQGVARASPFSSSAKESYGLPPLDKPTATVLHAPTKAHAPGASASGSWTSTVHFRLTADTLTIDLEPRCDVMRVTPLPVASLIYFRKVGEGQRARSVRADEQLTGWRSVFLRRPLRWPVDAKPGVSNRAR